MLNKYIEKKIEIPIFFLELFVDISNFKELLIQEIEKGILEKSNMNFKSNVKGYMTNWNYFLSNINLHKILDIAIQEIENFHKLKKCYLHDAWGIKVEKGQETEKHNHSQSLYSGVLYLNETELVTVFDDLNIQIKPKEGTFLFFSSELNHSVKMNKFDKPKYAISFNFNAIKSWD